MNKERFEAFTDAVIAIIMTILVLDIHLPTDDHSIHPIIAIAPSFIAYIVSFTILAVRWVNHHNLFLHIETINHKILYTNIFLLFCATLLPATTAWFGSDIYSPIAAWLYALNVIIYNISFSMLRNEVLKINSDLKHLYFTEFTSLILNIVALVIVFFWPPFIIISLLLDILLWAIQPIVHHKN
ncbi:TMEM175 family protein [Weissella kandleri]|uniref:TMEM175 family protein n=1 Tax=Weissella kandleri TaxID=1616 RepID=UPI00387E59B2